MLTVEPWPDPSVHPLHRPAQKQVNSTCSPCPPCHMQLHLIVLRTTEPSSSWCMPIPAGEAVRTLALKSPWQQTRHAADAGPCMGVQGGRSR